MTSTMISEPDFEAVQATLAQRLELTGAGIGAGQFGSLLDPLMRGVLERGFAEARADEGSVWLVDAAGENLVPAYNNGPNAAKLVGQFRQPLATGLISMVFASEQPFLENEVPQNSQQSRLLDTYLHVQTSALIAVPFSFLDRCRGVISCVQLSAPTVEAAGRSGFTPSHLASVQRTASVLSRLIEYRLLRAALGWSAA